jgi:hypothetical protein
MCMSGIYFEGRSRKPKGRLQYGNIGTLSYSSILHEGGRNEQT